MPPSVKNQFLSLTEDEGYSEYLCGYPNAHEGCSESGSVETCYCLEDLCNGVECGSEAHVAIVTAVLVMALWVNM